jgi:hypothetical protein
MQRPTSCQYQEFPKRFANRSVSARSSRDVLPPRRIRSAASLAAAPAVWVSTSCVRLRRGQRGVGSDEPSMLATRPLGAQTYRRRRSAGVLVGLGGQLESTGQTDRARFLAANEGCLELPNCRRELSA